MEAHASLVKRTAADVVVVEGAGSCVEMNLMDRDIVNLPLVRRLQCPWLLVADIDKGGVFAQIVGTKALVDAADWELCCGVVVNRLRGDPKYFEPGPTMIQELVGKPVFVVPWLDGLNLPDEDGMGTERRLTEQRQRQRRQAMQGSALLPLVVVCVCPHIAITSDLVPLDMDESVDVDWLTDPPCSQQRPVQCVILPGSKIVRQDIDYMVRTGWFAFLRDFAAGGGRIIGVCGGYQILGLEVSDPLAVEGEAGCSRGLGLLPVETTLAHASAKRVRPVRGHIHPPATALARGGRKTIPGRN